MFVYNIVLIGFAVSPAVSSAVRNLASIPACRASEFSCLDGTCIRAGAVCDTYWDCPDGSDEASCYSSTNSNLTEATVSHERYKRQSACGSNQWRCTDGACIAGDGKCDGKTDCPDKSDETHALCGNIKPTVTAKCVLPPYPEHGTYVETKHPSALPGQSFENAQLLITCEQGYGVVGDVVPYCLDGTWHTPIQKCVPFCRLDHDVSVHYYCQIHGTESYRLCNQSEPSGTVVKPECNAPVYGSTDRLLSMTCRSDGKWNRIIKCQPECGRVTPFAEGLIRGGTEAVRGELPWHVAVYEKHIKKKSYKQICGGSLVSNRIVISAAHCFGGKDKNGKPPASKYAVATAKLFRQWDHKDDKDAQKSELKSIELSPYYQGVRTNFQHDIAVLTLETPFVYNISVRPVCLDFDNDFNKRQLQVGNFGKVAGWGLIDRNGPRSPVLKVVELPFVPIQECILITPENFTESITGDKICAGYNNGTAAVCQGDSGGGLSFPESVNGTTRYYLRGIVSTAPRVAQKCNVFTVTTFTEIYQHKDFINQFISTKCTLPQYPEHGIYEVIGDPAAKPGDDTDRVNLNVSCNHGHSVIGNNLVQCILGEWSTRMPECVPVCYLQEHPSVTYSCNRPGAEQFGPCGEYEPRGTSVKPECLPGYYSPGAMPRMRCVDGTWDYVAQCTPECGRLSDNATTLPWNVHVYKKVINSDKNQRICSGTIVSPNIVISAAHCFWNADENKLNPSGVFEITKNYLGAISDEEKLPVKEVKITDRYQDSKTSYQDDIALVTLSQAFTYSRQLLPVCLDFDDGFNEKQSQNPTLGTVQVFPYRSDEVTTEQSLQQIQRLNYIPIGKCLELAISQFWRTQQMADTICAAKKNGTLMCSRIGGAGLAFPEVQRGVVRYYLRGVQSLISRSVEICEPTDFLILTDVNKHEDFIREHLATSLPPRVTGWSRGVATPSGGVANGIGASPLTSGD